MSASCRRYPGEAATSTAESVIASNLFATIISHLMHAINHVHPAILKHVVDAHCHPTDSHISPEDMNTLPITICAMSTRASDQAIVRDLATAHPGKVIPCFGYHPWFVHWISLGPAESKENHYHSLFLTPESRGKAITDDDRAVLERMLPTLPDPTPLADILTGLRTDLLAFPNAMLGEVGIDRACRVPLDHNVAQRGALGLSAFTIPLAHQLAVLEAQAGLAVELHRNISLHSVKAPQPTLQFLACMKAKHGLAWSAISIDLHSCGLSVETWRHIQTTHSNAYLSLSTAINGRSAGYKQLALAVSPDRILVESDFNHIAHCASRTWDMLRIVAEIHNWPVEETWDDDAHDGDWGAVRRLEENWKGFMKGGHTPADVARESKKARKLSKFRGLGQAEELSD